MKTKLNLHKAAALAGVSLLSASISGFAAADQQAGPSSLTELDSGYLTLAKGETEGKCGEGKCGADSKADAEGKCGEG